MSHAGVCEGLEKLCPLGFEWFSRSTQCASTSGLTSAELDSLATQLASQLTLSRNPLIHGGSRSALQTVRSMVALADASRGIFDSSELHRMDWPLAIQSQGISTATWGEVRDRADVLIYFGFNPSHALPRHRERFGDRYAGQQGTSEPKERWVAAIGPPAFPPGEVNLNLVVSPENILPFVMRLRSNLRDVPAIAATNDPAWNVSERMVERIQKASFAAFVLGPSFGDVPWTRSGWEQILRFVREANTFTRCVCVRETGAINAEGAMQVATWQTGYPGAIRFSRGYPEYDPFHANTQNLLESGEPDLVLSVESQLGNWCTPKIQHFLQGIPHVILDHAPQPRFAQASKFIQTGVAGRDYPAIFGRSDGIWVRSEDNVPSGLQAPPAFVVLDAVLAKIKSTSIPTGNP